MNPRTRLEELQVAVGINSRITHGDAVLSHALCKVQGPLFAIYHRIGGGSGRLIAGTVASRVATPSIAESPEQPATATSMMANRSTEYLCTGRTFRSRFRIPSQPPRN